MSAASTLAPELLALSSLIEEHPQTLASGSKALQAAALQAATFVFDLAIKAEERSIPSINDLLKQLSPDEAPETRSAKKRKLAPAPMPSLRMEPTPLISLFTDGMDDDQIWAQLDIRAASVCRTLQLALEGPEEPGEESEGEFESGDEEGEDAETKALRKAMAALENGEDMDMDGMDFGDEEDEDAFLDEDIEEDEGVVEEESESDDNVDLGEGVAKLRDGPSDEEEDSEDDDLGENPHRKAARALPKPKKGGRRSELDDGFFDLAAFNVETEAGEARSSSKGGLGGSDDESDDMSVDLFAPVNENDEDPEGDAMDLGGGADDNSAEPMYQDFFEPPPRSFTKPAPPTKSKGKGKGKAAHVSSSPLKPSKPSKVRFSEEVRVKNIKAKGKNLPLSGVQVSYEDDDEEDEGEDGFGEMDVEDEDDEGDDELDEFPTFGGQDEDDDEDDEDEESGDEDEGRETITRLKDDLFADERDVDTSDLTTHQKRMAALKDQIAELETQNVGPKDWTLMGEANTRARPQNSLLEEDLEFERVMKAVPVVTEESVAILEERIKARILEGRFDDVVRIRAVEDKPFLPSRFFELKDTKSAQSLSQIYEDEYTAAQTGGVAGEDKDGKLKKEHGEIEALWDGICGKLDALCNAHFMPKQPKATISTIANISTTSLESALPTTKSASTMLAPEEVFAASASDSRARTELTPGEKRTLRGKERKLKKKTRDALDTSVDKYATMRGIGGVKKRKQAALESVVKHGKGVTVVGKSKKDILAKKGRRPQAI